MVCIEGDSAFGFSGMEMETMVRYWFYEFFSNVSFTKKFFNFTSFFLIFKVRCKRTGQGGTGKSKADKDTTSGSGTSTILDEKIYSNSIKPIARPGMPSETKDVGPIHDDILIAKMRPGILFPFPS